MTRTISSQRYLDEAIVAAKVSARDFTVCVSPEFQIDGETFQVVLDGHHSLAAAREAGVTPDYVTATAQDHDAVSLISKNVELFLEVAHCGDNYYDVETGVDVW